MKSTEKPIANPMVVLREEFDDWAILFDPGTGEGFGINPVSVFIWNHLDGKHTADDILVKLRAECNDTPEDAAQFIEEFIDTLLEKGLAGYEDH